MAAWGSEDDWHWFLEWNGGPPETEHWFEQLSRPGGLTAALNICRANMAPETLAAPRRNCPHDVSHDGG